MRPTTAAACLLTMTGSAFAQSGVATYSIAFGTPTGPNSIMLAQGHSTIVYVNVSFSPGVGGGNPPAAGLSDGRFSITGTGTGTVTWGGAAFPFPWSGPKWFPGPQPSGNSLVNAVWGYGFLLSLPHPYPQNPATVCQASFIANSAGAVDFAFTNLGPTGVFAGTTGLPTVVTYASSPGLGGHVTILACYADCDGSGGLTIADFGCFQTKFAAADPYADCDHNGSHTIGDFGCFQAKFVAGCP